MGSGKITYVNMAAMDTTIAGIPTGKKLITLMIPLKRLCDRMATHDTKKAMTVVTVALIKTILRVFMTMPGKIGVVNTSRYVSSDRFLAA